MTVRPRATNNLSGNRGGRVIVDDPHEIGFRAIDDTAKVAIVKGAAASGAAVARALAAMGAEVVVFGQGNGQLAEAIGGWDLASAPDVTHYRWVPTLDPRTRRTHEEFGRLFTPRDALDDLRLEMLDMPPPVHLGMFNCRGDYVWPGMTEEQRQANRNRHADLWRDQYEQRPEPSDTPPRACDLPAQPISKRRARRLRGRSRL